MTAAKTGVRTLRANLDFKTFLIYFCLIGMEICWLYILLLAANKAVDDALAIPLLLAVYIISFGVSRGLRFLRWRKPLVTALSWAFWPAAMLLMIKLQLYPAIPFNDPAWLGSIPHALGRVIYAFEPALLILLSSAVLWWLGRRAAYARAEFSTAVTEFQLGLVMLVIVFFTAYTLDLDQSGSIPAALAFFALALGGISLSHSSRGGWYNSQKRGHFSGMLIVSIGLILVCGLILSLIFTPGLIQRLVDFAIWVWGLIERLFMFFASLLPAASPPDSQFALPTAPAVTPDVKTGFQWPEWLKPSLTLVWEIMVAGLLLAALWRIASQIFGWMRRQGGRGSGEVESLKGAFRMDLLDWIKRLLTRLFGIRFRSSKRAGARPLPAEIATVRQLYGQLLQWAAKRGYPRQEYQTAEEYRYVLNEVLPDNREDLAFITGAYVRARYSPALPTEAELERLKQSWQKLSKAELKKGGKT